MVVAEIEVASISVLKTFDPQPTALRGLAVTDVTRHGKFIDIDVDGLHLVIHLARAGWLRWSDRLAQTRLKLGNGPIALRVRLDAGTGPTSGLRPHRGRHPQGARGVRRPRPAGRAGHRRRSDPIRWLTASRSNRCSPDDGCRSSACCATRRHVAGIGNAYSDEILHAAKLSPFAMASELSAEEVERLERAIHDVLTDAIDRGPRQGGVRPQGQQAQPDARARAAPARRARCAATRWLEVVFADSSLQYCPTCQTGGKRLKDRSTSKFLK